MHVTGSKRTSSAFGRDMSRVLWLALRASHKCHKQAYGWPFGPAICKFYLKLKCLLKRHIWVFERQQTCDEQTWDMLKIDVTHVKSV